MTVVIDREAAAAALSPRAVVDAVASSLAAAGGRPSMREVVALDDAHAHVVAGGADGRLVVKTNVWHGGGVGGAVMLLSERGDLLAVLDSGALTAARTAALTVHAIERLRPGTHPVVALLGAGRQGLAQCRSLLALVDVAELRVWSLKPALASELAGRVGGDVVVAASVTDAVAGADVIVTVTPSTEPYLPSSLLSPSALVIALGADTVEKAELGQDVLEEAVLVGVDLPVVRRHGELRRVPHRPALELADAVPDAALTVVASAGSALLDLAAANDVLATVDPALLPTFDLTGSAAVEVS